MSQLQVKVLREPDCEDLPLPEYATAAAAGVDLRAAVAVPITLDPGERRLIRTGLRIALPEGYEAQVRPRSGLAIRHGIGMVNSPGTIDADYRGEIKIILINLSQEEQTIHPGDRIAQMVVHEVERVKWKPVKSISVTKRHDGGFGHTGKS